MITERRVPVDDEAYDKQLDHLVDTKGYSYHDARLEIGERPSEQQETVTAQVKAVGKAATRSTVRRRPRRRRSGHGPQYGEEEGVGYPGGKPPYYQPYVPMSDEQRETNRRGVEAARAAIRKEDDE